MRYHFATMVALALYISIVVLLLATSATTLCLAYYGMFKHRAAFWLFLCMAGLAWFALTMLVIQIANSMVSSAFGPQGLRVLFQALGGVFIAHSLPRFLLAAFGTEHRPFVYRLLDAATAAIAILSAIRVVTGWKDFSAIAPLPAAILRIFLFALIGGALALTLVFQSRLPDRSLYKAAIVQAGALTLLFPFVVLEDYGLFNLSGFP